MTPETIFDAISLLMFIIVGATLASAGVSVIEKPVQFFIIMIAMAVVKTIGLTR